MAEGSTGTNVVTGSGIIDQGLGWFNAYGDFVNDRYATDTNAATARYAADSSAGASRYSADKSYQAAMLQYSANMQQIRNQYDIDLKNYGLNVAQLNFQQRTAAAQIDLARKGFGLDIANSQLGVDQFNYAQRTGVADRKMAIMDMLARRTGPQDWVAYSSLLNQLSPPDPTGSATIDPFQMLEGLYEPASLQMPEWAQGEPGLAAGISQPYSAAPGIAQQARDIDAAVANIIGSSGYGSGAGVTTPTAPAPAATSGAFTPTGQGWNMVGGNAPNGDELLYNYRGSPQPGVSVFEDPKPARAPQLVDPKAAPGATGVNPASFDAIFGYTPKPMNRGGATNFPMLLTGDKAKGRTGYEELVINLNPDPSDALMVLDRHDTKKVLDSGAKPERAASGGPFTLQAGGLAGGAGGKTLRNNFTPAESAAAATKLGSNTAPDGSPYEIVDYKPGYGPNGQTPQSPPADRMKSFTPGPAASPSPLAPQPKPTGNYDANYGLAGMPGWQGFGEMPTFSYTPQAPADDSRKQRMADLMTQAQQRFASMFGGPARPAMTPLAEAIARSRRRFRGRGNMPGLVQMVQANTGGVFTANTDPFLTVNQYSPETLGSQPFIQKTRGSMGSTPFGGFGAPLSNPSIGVENMPSLINLRDWGNLQPSEKDALEELYNRGLGVDMRDIIERSRRAAPMGASFGPARYGG